MGLRREPRVPGSPSAHMWKKTLRRIGGHPSSLTIAPLTSCRHLIRSRRASGSPDHPNGGSISLSLIKSLARAICNHFWMARTTPCSLSISPLVGVWRLQSGAGQPIPVRGLSWRDSGNQHWQQSSFLSLPSSANDNWTSLACIGEPPSQGQSMYDSARQRPLSSQTRPLRRYASHHWSQAPSRACVFLFELHERAILTQATNNYR